MNTVLSIPLFTGALFVGMLLFLELGRWKGARARHGQPGEIDPGLTAVDGAVFALFGLLIAFTFSSAAARYDTRRQLIADEANAVGVAYLRLDLVSPELQPPLRQLFRDYLDARLAAYRLIPDTVAAFAQLARSNRLQGEIWTQAVAATRAANGHPDAGRLLLPAINQMIDITTVRTLAARMHPPRLIFYLLFGLALLCSLLAGIGMGHHKDRNWVHMIGFAVIVAATVLVILGIEYPRMGLTRLPMYDQVLADVRASMK
jgi:hypothetical protein